MRVIWPIKGKPVKIKEAKFLIKQIFEGWNWENKISENKKWQLKELGINLTWKLNEIKCLGMEL
jgi:hypothetical protein